MRRRFGQAAALVLVSGTLFYLSAGNPVVERKSPIELNNLATQLYAEGRFQEAEALYRKALENWPAETPEALRGRAMATANLGTVLRATGRYADAEPLLLESLKQLETAAGPDSADVAHTLTSIAALYRSQGNLARAEVFALRASKIGAPKDQADARLNLASIYIEEQRYDEAEALLQPELDRAQGTVAAVLYNNLATAATARKDFARSEELARTALESARRSVPETHPLVATILNNMAQACRFQGKFLDAETNYRKAIEIWEAALGPVHPDVARGLMNLASFYHERGRDSGAESLYRRAAEIFADRLGETSIDTLIARNELAEVLRTEHRYVESEKLVHATLASLENKLKPQDPRFARALVNHARLLHDTRRQGEADAILHRLQNTFDTGTR
jgi:tetratricopeptide (TPR) repeat protein